MRPGFIGMRDSDGYEVRGYEKVVRRPGPWTILGGPREGTYILGKSGRPQIATEDNTNVWKRLLQITGPEQLAHFMSQFGPLGLIRDPQKKYETPWKLLEDEVNFLRTLAQKADAYDRKGFEAQALHRKLMVQQLGFVPSSKNNGGAIGLRVEFACLADYLIWQMWNALDGCDHLGSRIAKPCIGCGSVFFSGGMRQKGSRRADAQYCSDHCRDSANKRRRRIKDHKRQRRDEIFKKSM